MQLWIVLIAVYVIITYVPVHIGQHVLSMTKTFGVIYQIKSNIDV